MCMFNGGIALQCSALMLFTPCSTIMLSLLFETSMDLFSNEPGGRCRRLYVCACSRLASTSRESAAFLPWRCLRMALHRFRMVDPGTPRHTPDLDHPEPCLTTSRRNDTDRNAAELRMSVGSVVAKE